MRRLREQIERAQGIQRVSSVEQPPRVARERRRIARHVDERAAPPAARSTRRLPSRDRCAADRRRASPDGRPRDARRQVRLDAADVRVQPRRVRAGVLAKIGAARRGPLPRPSLPAVRAPRARPRRGRRRRRGRALRRCRAPPRRPPARAARADSGCPGRTTRRDARSVPSPARSPASAVSGSPTAGSPTVRHSLVPGSSALRPASCASAAARASASSETSRARRQLEMRGALVPGDVLGDRDRHDVARRLAIERRREPLHGRDRLGAQLLRRARRRTTGACPRGRSRPAPPGRGNGRASGSPPRAIRPRRSDGRSDTGRAARTHRGSRRT